MPALKKMNESGVVYLEEVRRGRRRYVGSHAYVKSTWCTLVGYTDDNQAVYVPDRQLNFLNRSVDTVKPGIFFRLALWVISRYEPRQA